MRTDFVNRNTKNNHHAYNRKTESRTVKLLEKRVQNRPSNTRRMEGTLAIVRLNTRYEKMAG